MALNPNTKAWQRNTMIVLVLIATFAGMLNSTTLATAVPTLTKDFNISMSTAQQASTWFLLGNGIMIPVTAYLILKFKTKHLYIFAYIAIFIGTLMVFITPTSNYNIFLIGRIIQSIGVGITMPLLQVVLVELFPAEKRGAAMGLAGFPMALAPALGPTFAGWVLNANHHFLGFTLAATWRSIFFVPLVIIGICLVLSPFIIKNVLENEQVHLDFLSFIMSILGFGFFLWGFTNVASDGWTKFSTVLAPIIGGLIVIALFVVRQLHMKEPFLDMRVFKVKQFTISTLTLAVVTMAMMGVEMMLPIYLQEVRGLSALSSGLVLLPGSLLMTIVMLVSGRVFDKIGGKRLALTGFFLLAIGTFPFMFLNLSVSEHFITTVYGVRMIAVAMIMMSMFSSALNALPKNEVAHGTASSNTARQIASSVVVALFSSVTQNVTNNHAPAHALKAIDPLKYASQTMDAALKGFHVSFTMAFIFSILGIVVACFLQAGKIIIDDKDLEVKK
ncbi:MDR family MFS transporter [Lactococcus nasutitermitis]|uniref:MDR family MFS transporter n=1 Tax=Lactococcus nasutitermitis TaxID=1652957 RepID=A0ABV9JCH2_9LACT|nr:MDR family MFS transporter [Lactococcus nasutitermitis]